MRELFPKAPMDSRDDPSAYVGSIGREFFKKGRDGVHPGGGEGR